MLDTEKSFLSLLGYVFLQNARPDKASVVLAALDTLEPGQPKVLVALALAQLRSGKPERSLETLDRLAMAGGVDAAFHLLRAQALSAAGHGEEAGVAMRTYLQMRETQRTATA